MKEKESPFRIEKKASFHVIGYAIQTSNQKGEGKKAIPAFWNEVRTNHKEEVLFQYANGTIDGLLGINIYNIDAHDARIFQYMIGVSSDITTCENLVTYEIPARTWAIFPCTLETIGKMEAQAITKWLPKNKKKPLNKGYITGRMKSGAPDIEYYGKDGQVEVWIAIEE